MEHCPAAKSSVYAREDPASKNLQWLPESLFSLPFISGENRPLSLDPHSPQITCPSLERQQHRLRHFLRTPPQPTHPPALPQCRHLLSPGEGWWDRRGEPGLTLTADRQARLPGVSGSGLTVSPVVHLLGAVRKWKAPQFGRTGREPIGRVLGDG